MAEYYEALGEVQKTSPMPADGQINLPSSVRDAVPLRLRNLPPDEIAFAGPETVLCDSNTHAITIDTQDLVQALPGNEWGLRNCPALMRVFTTIGSKAVDGFLVDYRQIAVFRSRYSGLEEGAESSQFQSLRETHATVFPLGVILNDAGIVHYIGHPELQDRATDMMERVDTFIAERWPHMAKYTYLLPNVDEIIRPSPPETGTLPSPRLSDEIPSHAASPLFIEPHSDRASLEQDTE